MLPFLIKDENLRPNYPNIYQINTDIVSQLAYMPIMTAPATLANRPSDHNIDKIRSNQSIVTERVLVRKCKQKLFTGFQPQIQTTSVISN